MIGRITFNFIQDDEGQFYNIVRFDFNKKYTAIDGLPLAESLAKTYQNLISESIHKLLVEIGETPKGQYALGALAGDRKARNFDNNTFMWHLSDDENCWKDLRTYHDAYRRAEKARGLNYDELDDDGYGATHDEDPNFFDGYEWAFKRRRRAMGYNESKTYKNNSLHNTKNTIRLTESQLMNIIEEVALKVLKEAI